MLPLYQPLNFNHHAMQQQLAYLCLNLGLIHDPSTAVDTKVDPNLLWNEAPTIKNFTSTFGLEIATSHFIVIREMGDTGIYLEQQSRAWAKIEIPIIGGEYAHTAFYMGKVTGLKQMPTGLNCWQYDQDTAQELDRFTLLKPTVINIQVPRRTQVTRVHVRRVSLVLDVGPRATELLQQSPTE